MRRDEILRRPRVHRAELERYGVVSLAIFGSAARDELKEGSDIDILVEMKGMRNVLIYEYFGVDLKAIWDTVQTDLVSVTARLENILAENQEKA